MGALVGAVALPALLLVGAAGLTLTGVNPFTGLNVANVLAALSAPVAAYLTYLNGRRITRLAAALATIDRLERELAEIKTHVRPKASE